MRRTQAPNILFILTDDQAAWTLGAEGHPNARTPVLDSLAEQGVLFRSMFATSAVCSPSRASVLTGRYPSEVGFGPDGRVWLAGEERHIDPCFPSWPTVLRQRGYRTALIGKWHLGQGRPERLPGQNGYERFRGFAEGPDVTRDPSVEIDGVFKEFPGQFTSDVLADLAIETLREWRDQTFARISAFLCAPCQQPVPAGLRAPVSRLRACRRQAQPVVAADQGMRICGRGKTSVCPFRIPTSRIWTARTSSACRASTSPA